MKDLHSFQEFENIEDAEEMAAILKQHGIDGRVEKYNPLLDQNIIGTQYNEYIQLKLAPADFDKARKILIDAVTIDMNSVDRRYMLFSLNNKELMDVIAKPDEWGVYNYKLAQLILKERGTEMNEEKAASVQTERIEELSKPKSLDDTWVFLGYFFSIIAIGAGVAGSVTALNLVYCIGMCPGILGIIIGSRVMRVKKTLPNGTQVLVYDARTRAHGKLMLILGLCALVFNIYVLASGKFQ